MKKERGDGDVSDKAFLAREWCSQSLSMVKVLKYLLEEERVTSCAAPKENPSF